ncbi:50S ribosomal protein L28 [Candidatus Parcubacteria bacterium]|nr:50S ribosomal protein L28 [Patescibacteria group bacterium]MCG2694183.1 50S ribosomal protein L28 [Candidatus Parcubacteria bacterium]
MSRRCDICGRGSKKAASRSHSNIKTLRRQYVNLQARTIDGEKKKVCTKCIKTMKKDK